MRRILFPQGVKYYVGHEDNKIRSSNCCRSSSDCSVYPQTPSVACAEIHVLENTDDAETIKDEEKATEEKK